LNSNHRFSAQKIARAEEPKQTWVKKKELKKQKAYLIILRSYSLAPLATTTESTLLFIPTVTLDLLNEDLE